MIVVELITPEMLIYADSLCLDRIPCDCIGGFDELKGREQKSMVSEGGL
jgi:hypothetical protein